MRQTRRGHGYSAARLLAASVLAAFPNSALTDPTIEDRHDAHPGTVRQAYGVTPSHTLH